MSVNQNEMANTKKTKPKAKSPKVYQKSSITKNVCQILKREFNNLVCCHLNSSSLLDFHLFVFTGTC